MRKTVVVCDRCGEADIKSAATFGFERTVYDFCKRCVTAILVFTRGYAARQKEHARNPFFPDPDKQY